MCLRAGNTMVYPHFTVFRKFEFQHLFRPEITKPPNPFLTVLNAFTDFFSCVSGLETSLYKLTSFFITFTKFEIHPITRFEFQLKNKCWNSNPIIAQDEFIDLFPVKRPLLRLLERLGESQNQGWKIRGETVKFSSRQRNKRRFSWL